MRIHFERSGGFMGMRIAGTVDTDSLPTEDALDLRQMVDAARFFDLPASFPASATGADQFQYKLVVEDEERQHTVEMTDVTSPDELRPLLRRLTILTRSKGSSSP